MRLFVALSFLASTLSATTFFDPPNPTSATPVVAHVTIPPSLCPPSSADVARNGANIAITLHFPPCPLTPPGFVPFDFAVSLGVLPAGSTTSSRTARSTAARSSCATRCRRSTSCPT